MHQRKRNTLLKFVAALFIVVTLVSIKGSIKGSLAGNFTNLIRPAAASINEQMINVWWPTQDAHISGLQPFKAMLQNWSVNDYRMYWQVDGGKWNGMDNSDQDFPHKESMVDLSDWNWNSEGKYTLNFIATDLQGNKIMEKTVTIYANEPNQNRAGKISNVQAVSIDRNSSKSSGQSKMDIWWPTNNSRIMGLVPFKGLVNIPLNTYRMYWQVDGDRWNSMGDSLDVFPHKESMVDLSDWNWNGEGPYNLKFIATDLSGNVIKEQKMTIYVPKSDSISVVSSVSSVSAPDPAPSIAPELAPASAPTPTPVNTPLPSYSQTNSQPSITSSDNPFQGVKLYVNPNSDAKRQADAWRTSRPADAAMMDKIAKQSGASWIGDWNPNSYSDVKRFTDEMTAQGAMPVFVAYNIPKRDCGGYSAGGASSPDAYKSWIRGFADGIGNRKAAVILEPDALANMNCLSSSDQETRLGLFQDAINVFNAKGNISVYVDAAHPNWISTSEMASRLKRAGMDKAKGFALNVSNYYTNADNANYGSEISNLTGGKHFVIDTSRNGLGPTPDSQWCNPPGRAIGTPPTTNTGNSLIDAYLWLKDPGASDGTCNGGPAAGVFWPDYALGLAQRASW